MCKLVKGQNGKGWLSILSKEMTGPSSTITRKSADVYHFSPAAFITLLFGHIFMRIFSRRWFPNSLEWVEAWYVYRVHSESSMTRRQRETGTTSHVHCGTNHVAPWWAQNDVLSEDSTPYAVTNNQYQHGILCSLSGSDSTQYTCLHLESKGEGQGEGGDGWRQIHYLLYMWCYILNW